MAKQYIEAVLTDIDGVLTDGKLILSEKAELCKKLCFKDLDAVQQLRTEGIKFGIISGENDGFTELVNEKMCPDFYFPGCKDKKKIVERISEEYKIKLESICYIGDGKYDIEALKIVGMGVCPSDAIEEVKHAADIVLERMGGEGCLSSVVTLLQSKKNEQLDGRDILLKSLSEHKRILDLVYADETLHKNILTVAEEIVSSLKRGGQLLICGNGGSAADAQHLATELVSRFYCERKAYNAEALTVNSSTLTAVGNDYAFDKIFARQVEAKGKETDVLLGISTSGESKNVIEAIKTAKKIGMKTVAFTGINDSTVDGLSDIIIKVPSAEVPRIQEMHIFIGHMICEMVEKNLN